MTSRWIDITAHDAGTFSGYLALPPTGSGPGIVLVQEIWGVNEHIRAVADQYALAGYVVLAPDVFWRLEPRVELSYNEADSAKAFALYGKLDFDLAPRDVASAIETLRTLPEVTGKTGVVGFCLGGQLAYRAAPIAHADAAVAYYGGGIDQYLDDSGSVTMPIVFHYANNDQHISQGAVQAVKQAFSSKPNATFFDYPDTDHGFNCWGRPAMYNQHASALAHGRTLEFLSKNL